MGTFSFKNTGKKVWQEAQPILLGTAGVIASQKFLDFKKLFPNMDPTKPLIKHEGIIKVGGVLIALSMIKKVNPMLKYLLYGVAIQGGIKAVRTYTVNKETGVSFVDQIGAGDYDAQIMSLAADVKTVANEFGTTVGTTHSGVNRFWETNPAVALNINASTGVGSMGMGMDEAFSPVSGVGAMGI
jgi:hypothetical protein